MKAVYQLSEGLNFCALMRRLRLMLGVLLTRQ